MEEWPSLRWKLSGQMMSAAEPVCAHAACKPFRIRLLSLSIYLSIDQSIYLSSL